MGLGPVGPGGAPVGHGFRASNNLFRGPCIKKVKKPCCRGFGLVSRAPLGRLCFCPGGPDEARWVPVGPGGMFIDTLILGGPNMVLNGPYMVLYGRHMGPYGPQLSPHGPWWSLHGP